MAPTIVRLMGPDRWTAPIAALLRSAGLDMPVETFDPPACNLHPTRPKPPREAHVTRPDDSWMDRAACRELTPDVFFEAEHEAAAITVCNGCPVRHDCAEFAINSPDNWADVGMWGGLTPRQRQQIRNQRRLNVGLSPIRVRNTRTTTRKTDS